MSLGLPIRWLLAPALLLGACGARPGMDPALDGTVAPDAVLLGGDSEVPLPDAEVVVEPCEWLAGQWFQLTEPPNDKGLHTVAVTDQGALVAWQITNSPADNVRQLQRVSWRGEPDGEAVDLFPAPGYMTSYGGIRVAAGPDHFGATVWDESHGCRFRPIDASGAALGTPHTVASTGCGSLRSTSEGFSLITRSYSAVPGTLVRLDPDGQVLGESDPIPVLTGDVFWFASVLLPGGDLVVAGMYDFYGPHEIHTQRLDSTGTPLTDPVTINAVGPELRRVRLIHTGDGLLAGWLEADEEAPSNQHQRIVLQPLDLDGHGVGSPVRLDDRYAYRDSAWSIARKGDQLLIAFMEPQDPDISGDQSTLIVRPVTLDGQPDGPAVELYQGRFVRDTLIRSTPAGAVVVFQAFPDGEPHQIFSSSVSCETFDYEL